MRLWSVASSWKGRPFALGQFDGDPQLLTCQNAEGSPHDWPIYPICHKLRRQHAKIVLNGARGTGGVEHTGLGWTGREPRAADSCQAGTQGVGGPVRLAGTCR